MFLPKNSMYPKQKKAPLGLGYDRALTGQVVGWAGAAQLPLGGLLRYDVRLNASSDANASYAQAASVRAIFLGGARGSAGFAAQVPGAAGVSVASLPFFAAAPVRSPLPVDLGSYTTEFSVMSTACARHVVEVCCTKCG